MKPWCDLSIREKEQLRLMLGSLKEFSYGHRRADEAAGEFEQGSAPMRFYMNALYQYCANYFLVRGAHKLRNVLRDLGSADLLERVDRLLETPLGGTTFGEVIRTFRDKILTHQSFTFSELEARVKAKFDYLEPENAERLNALIMGLFLETKALYHGLLARYPMALDDD